MIRKTMFVFFVVVEICLHFPQPAHAFIIISEFLADPGLGLLGDANWDGVRNASDDEFVELLNLGPSITDISNWSLHDSSALRHSFAAGIQIKPQERLLVFGGGQPLGLAGKVFTASTGRLNLNNALEQIYLKNASGVIMDHVLYGSEADHDQSLVRFPEKNGTFQPHRLVSISGALFSPGQPTNPEKSITPEPSSALLLLTTLLGCGIFKMIRHSLTSID